MIRSVLSNLGEFTSQNLIITGIKTSLCAVTDPFCRIGKKFHFGEEKEIFYICSITAESV